MLVHILTQKVAVMFTFSCLPTACEIKEEDEEEGKESEKLGPNYPSTLAEAVVEVNNRKMFR